LDIDLGGVADELGHFQELPLGKFLIPAVNTYLTLPNARWTRKFLLIIAVLRRDSL
jgi:hypothetical protein